MPKLKIKMSPFADDVIKAIKLIPKGKVATYGQIARLAGKPHASRAVGWILNSCARSHRLPWQRVLNSQGRISFHPDSSEYANQKRLLKGEGVEFKTKHGLELSRFQWKKDRKVRSVKKRGTPSMFAD